MTMTEVVTGTLAGMSCEADCALLVTRAEGPGQRAAMYARCVVVQAPEWLPDGYYEAIFCGQSAFLHRRGGEWSEGVPWLLSSPERQNPKHRVSPGLECMRIAS